MAANVPVPSGCVGITAALVGMALAAEPDGDEVEAAVSTVVADVDEGDVESPEVFSTSVAFRVPHCWFLMHVSCPCASSGFASMHCL